MSVAIVKTATVPRVSYLGYIHSYRALSAVLVVTIHCRVLLSNWENQVAMLLASRSTLLFVFIGGYIFQHLSAKFNARAHLHSKVKNLLVPYLVLSAFILGYRCFLIDMGTDPLKIGYSWFYQVVTGSQLYLYWYIPMIFIFHLLAPLLVRLDRSQRGYLVLPFFLMASLFVTRSHHFMPMPLQYGIHYFSVYLLGMFCSHHKARFFSLLRQFRFLLLGTFVAIIWFEYCYPLVLIEQLQFVQKCLLVFLSLYCFRRYERFIPTQVNWVADISFGIYLVHGIILEFLEHVIRHYYHRLAILEYSLLNLVLVVVLVNALTILVIKTVQWLFPRSSRYIVGC